MQNMMWARSMVPKPVGIFSVEKNSISPMAVTMSGFSNRRFEFAEEDMKIERCTKKSFVVIGKEGSTKKTR